MQQTFRGAVIRITPGHSLADVGFRNNDSMVMLLHDKRDSKGKLVVVNLEEVSFRAVKGDRGIAEVCKEFIHIFLPETQILHLIPRNADRG